MFIVAWILLEINLEPVIIDLYFLSFTQQTHGSHYLPGLVWSAKETKKSKTTYYRKDS